MKKNMRLLIAGLLLCALLAACGHQHIWLEATCQAPKTCTDCGATDSMDIMYTISLGSTIPQLFTRLDAYYLGLVDSCDEVDAWGLGKSTYLE